MDIKNIDREFYNKIPQSTLESLDLYVNQRISGGGFLDAVLSNNLKDAVSRSDDKNQEGLCQIVKYIYNNAPMSCWGSKEKVDNWLNNVVCVD